MSSDRENEGASADKLRTRNSSDSDVSEVVLWSSESSEESTDGEEKTLKSLLDFRSPTFSPVLALKCSTSEAFPVAEGARKFLNLQHYSKSVESPSQSPRKDVVVTKHGTVETKEKEPPESPKEFATTKQAKESSPPTDHFPIPGRRFLPHQLPVYRPRREHPNTVTLMETVEGPLSVLHRVMKDKTRIKLWTRRDKGFRGFLLGFVEAFDKHWNLVLRDVDEQFVRRRITKFPIIGDKVEYSGQGTTTSNNETAISSAFIRLKNYLRQNERSSMKGPRGNDSRRGRAARSKTVYVGDKDPLSICRAGLANLSLHHDDDNHHRPFSPEHCKTDKKGRAAPSSSCEKPDIVKCHQSWSFSDSRDVDAAGESSSSAARPIQQRPTRTSLKKKSLTVFKTPYEDSFGFMVVAQTRKYELVERHVGQVLLMGNDIVFIETSGC